MRKASFSFAKHGFPNYNTPTLGWCLSKNNENFGKIVFMMHSVRSEEEKAVFFRGA